MLCLADETWLALVGMVLSFLYNVVQAWQTRAQKADKAVSVDAVTEVALRYIKDPEVMDALRQQSVAKVREVRPRAAADLDTSMKVQISKSTEMEVRRLRGY